MIDYAKNLRLPLLVGVLVLTSVLMVNSVVQFVLELVHGSGIGDAGRAGAAESPSLVWVLTTLVLVLALVLVRPQPQGTVRIVRASSVVVAVAAGLALVFWILSLWEGITFGQILGSVGGLVETIAKGGIAALLHRLHGVGRRDLLAVLNAETGAEQLPANEPAKPTAPIWSADQATGYQWTSASQAAQGAAPDTRAIGSGPGSSGGDGGSTTRPAPDWGPARRDPGPEPDGDRVNEFPESI